MPTRNVNLTNELDRFVADKVESGRYENASEVVRAALRALEHEELVRATKLETLRTALIEGEQSGIAKKGTFQRVRARLGVSTGR